MGSDEMMSTSAVSRGEKLSQSWERAVDKFHTFVAKKRPPSRDSSEYRPIVALIEGGIDIYNGALVYDPPAIMTDLETIDNSDRGTAMARAIRWACGFAKLQFYQLKISARVDHKIEYSTESAVAVSFTLAVHVSA